jgi:hypothetical protein
VLFLEAEEIFARFFFIAFLNSPCYETPENAIKKNRTKQPREQKTKKTDEKKATFFVMSPTYRYAVTVVVSREHIDMP